MEAADEICKRLDEGKKHLGKDHSFKYWSKNLEDKKGSYVESCLVIEIPKVGKFDLDWLTPVLSIKPKIVQTNIIVDYVTTVKVCVFLRYVK